MYLRSRFLLGPHLVALPGSMMSSPLALSFPAYFSWMMCTDRNVRWDVSGEYLKVLAWTIFRPCCRSSPWRLDGGDPGPRHGDERCFLFFSVSCKE
ncbi:hypothetical protein HDV57DRAFT_469231 [Trichoderma longibrachiatum]